MNKLISWLSSVWQYFYFLNHPDVKKITPFQKLPLEAIFACEFPLTSETNYFRKVNEHSACGVLKKGSTWQNTNLTISGFDRESRVVLIR